VREQKREFLRREREREGGLLVVSKILEACVWACLFFSPFSFFGVEWYEDCAGIVVSLIKFSVLFCVLFCVSRALM
jgi:hypothetical protein